MSDQLLLSAETRERAGKGASRAMRREGRVPAVIYGDKKEPEAIHIEERALVKMLHTGHFMNSLVDIEIGGAKTRTLPKDVQFHPVSDRPLHVDFMRISKGAAVAVNVPVHFAHEEASPGLKRGGVLNVVRHELELNCPADAIPDEVMVDLTGLEVGDSVHMSAVQLPEGVTAAIEDRDFTIATVVAPSALKRSDSEAAAAEEAAGGAPAAEQGGDEEEGEGED